MLRFFKKQKRTAQIVRGLEGVYVDGEWIPSFANPVDIKIIAPQPITANDTVNLEDGEHVRDYLKTYTTEKVMVREESRNSDVIFWQGKAYKAYQTDNRNPLGNFYKTIIRREDIEVFDNYVIDPDTLKIVIDPDTGEAVTV